MLVPCACCIALQKESDVVIKGRLNPLRRVVASGQTLPPLPGIRPEQRASLSSSGRQKSMITGNDHHFQGHHALENDNSSHGGLMIRDERHRSHLLTCRLLYGLQVCCEPSLRQEKT